MVQKFFESVIKYSQLEKELEKEFQQTNGWLKISKVNEYTKKKSVTSDNILQTNDKIKKTKTKQIDNQKQVKQLQNKQQNLEKRNQVQTKSQKSKQNQNTSTKNILEMKEYERQQTNISSHSNDSSFLSTDMNSSSKSKINWRDFFNKNELEKAVLQSKNP